MPQGRAQSKYFNRSTEPRPLPKLLGNKSRDRMGRTHSNTPRSEPTRAQRRRSYAPISTLAITSPVE
jgi:hypothetical protein